MNVRQRHGGGLAVIYNPELKLKKLAIKAYSSFEVQKLEILDPKTKEKIHILNVYRTPYTKKHPVKTKQFLEDFTVLLKTTNFKNFYS